jgi:hypothetical protein
MNLTHLSYRLKGTPDVHRVSFESFEQAQDYLIEKGLQVVVGSLKGIEKPCVITEAAAHRVKADWFEFTHTEEA